jgi:hypothetical protein
MCQRSALYSLRARQPPRRPGAVPPEDRSRGHPDVGDVDLDRHGRDSRETTNLIAHVRAHGGCHLGEIEAVLDNDPKGDDEALRGPHDVDTALGAVTRHEPSEAPAPGGGADNAVALGRRQTGYLCDRLGGDGDLPLHGGGIRCAGHPRRLDDAAAREGDRLEDQTAFWTLPERRQRVQTYARVGDPSISTRTRWRLGSKRRFVAIIE